MKQKPGKWLVLALALSLVLTTAASTAADGVATGYRVHQFDLSDLPEYKPEQQAIGVLRLTGTPLDSLVGDWIGEFKNHHKRVRFSNVLVNTSQAVSGLVQGSADIGIMGHQTWLSSREAFEETYGYPPLEIHFANGSYDDPQGSTPGLVFFVHKDNPLKSLTLDQIDGIFGSSRTGGWKGTQWSTAAARGEAANLRSWKQLGIKGGLAQSEIVPYGTDVTLSNWADLIQKVAFQGGTKWNPALREGPRADVVAGNRDQWIVKSVGADPAGIGFMFQRAVDTANANVKVLPVAVNAQATPVTPSAESFRDQSYPFHNATYFYVNKKPGQPLQPREREFIRFVLSRQGQQIIGKDRRFIPLSAAELKNELKKLD